MISIALLVVATTIPSQLQNGFGGEIVSAIGTVQLDRQERNYRAVYGSGLLSNDRLTTSPVGGASLFVDGGAFIYLGPVTSVTLVRGGDGWVVRLDEGEVRVTSPGQVSMAIVTANTEVHVGRAIVRVAARHGDSRVWNEAGDVVVHDRRPNEDARRSVENRFQTVSFPNGNGGFELGSGQEVTIPRTGDPIGPHPATLQGWTIDDQIIQQRGLASASRSLKSSDDDTERDRDDQQTQQQTDTADATADAGQQGASQNNIATLSALSTGTGGLSSSFSGGSSGGVFGDRDQETKPNLGDNSLVEGPVYRITTQNTYTLSDVNLLPNEQSSQAKYYSIGLGPSPTREVTTVQNGDAGRIFFKENGVVIRIPHFDAYLLELTLQDPAADPVLGSNFSEPVAEFFPVPEADLTPIIPLRDDEISFDNTRTFAFGELKYEGNANPIISIRQTHDDRTKKNGADGGGQPNPALDVNEDFDTVPFNGSGFDEPGGLNGSFMNIQLPKSNVGSKLPTRRIRDLDSVRRAAVTTLLGDRLREFSRRTGQTRFVIDGRIFDITGMK